jgi:hypothetical protein
MERKRCYAAMAVSQFAIIVAFKILAVIGVRTIHGLCIGDWKHIFGNDSRCHDVLGFGELDVCHDSDTDRAI